MSLGPRVCRGIVASRGGLRVTYHVRRVQDSGRVKPAAVLPPDGTGIAEGVEEEAEWFFSGFS
ncbi:MAG: hypothetical protein ACXV3F_09805, partial [Frankiaceae bacterium]